MRCCAQYVVDFLVRQLGRTQEGDKMREIAVKLEETVWSEASSLHEYTERIKRKLQRVENSKAQPPAGKENGAAVRSVPAPGTAARPTPGGLGAAAQAAPAAPRAPPIHRQQQQQQQQQQQGPPPSSSSSLVQQPHAAVARRPQGRAGPSAAQQQQQQQPPQPPPVAPPRVAAALHVRPPSPSNFRSGAAVGGAIAPTARRGGAAIAAAFSPPPRTPPPPLAPPPSERPPNAAYQYAQLVTKLRTSEYANRRYLHDFCEGLRQSEEKAKSAAPEMARKVIELRTCVEEYLERLRERHADSQTPRGVADIVRLWELHGLICKDVLGRGGKLGAGGSVGAALASSGGGSGGKEASLTDTDKDFAPTERGVGDAGASAAGTSGAARLAAPSSLACAPRGLLPDTPVHRPPNDVIPLLGQLATALASVPAVGAKRQAFAQALGRLGGGEGLGLGGKRPRTLP